MTITHDERVDLATAIDRSRRRVRFAAWVLAVGWLATIASLLVVGVRESSYDQLEAGIRSGDITDVHEHGADFDDGATGFQSVSLTWRDHLGITRTASLVLASDKRAARDARRDNPTRPVVVGSVADHLTALGPDVTITRAAPRYPSWTIAGWQAPGSIGLAYLVLLVGTIGLIAGPRPWRATRWAWGWLVLLAPAVGIPAYFLLGGPLGLFRPRNAARVGLTGGWAFLLALLLGGASTS